MEKTLTITMVTVTYQAADLLENTIKSVIGQQLGQNMALEYWIVDGGSTDGTVEIVRRYAPYLAGWISEKDGGIYDAMNKGIRQATGDWIGFMNAGDRFENEQTLLGLFENLLPDTEIIYGNYYIDYQTFTKPKITPEDLKDFWKGMIVNHQSVLVKTELAKAFPFDLRYRLAADFAQLYGFYLQKRKFQKANIFVARFADGGESAQRKVECIQEISQIVKEKSNKIPEKYFFKILIFKTKLIALLKQFFSTQVFEWLMRSKNRLFFS